MTAVECFEAIKKYKIDLTPVLDRNGRISHWSAGKRCVIKETCMNYVSDRERATGETPEEAIARLLVILKKKRK